MGVALIDGGLAPSSSTGARDNTFSALSSRTQTNSSCMLEAASVSLCDSQGAAVHASGLHLQLNFSSEEQVQAYMDMGRSQVLAQSVVKTNLTLDFTVLAVGAGGAPQSGQLAQSSDQLFGAFEKLTQEGAGALEDFGNAVDAFLGDVEQTYGLDRDMVGAIGATIKSAVSAFFGGAEDSGQALTKDSDQTDFASGLASALGHLNLFSDRKADALRMYNSALSLRFQTRSSLEFMTTMENVQRLVAGDDSEFGELKAAIRMRYRLKTQGAVDLLKHTDIHNILINSMLQHKLNLLD